ncbi:uncharacterized protein LOC143900303 [Temnothorax americanus]|uniref:uncharacterized protein LOC143900303 n=1 Tax=Temnothorax americanus TaxID=1964332 RepID=UPI004067D279
MSFAYLRPLSINSSTKRIEVVVTRKTRLYTPVVRVSRGWNSSPGLDRGCRWYLTGLRRPNLARTSPSVRSRGLLFLPSGETRQLVFERLSRLARSSKRQRMKVEKHIRWKNISVVRERKYVSIKANLKNCKDDYLADIPTQLQTKYLVLLRKRTEMHEIKTET